MLVYIELEWRDHIPTVSTAGITSPDASLASSWNFVVFVRSSGTTTSHTFNHDRDHTQISICIVQVDETDGWQKCMASIYLNMRIISSSDQSETSILPSVVVCDNGREHDAVMCEPWGCAVKRCGPALGGGGIKSGRKERNRGKMYLDLSIRGAGIQIRIHHREWQDVYILFQNPYEYSKNTTQTTDYSPLAR